ncbi:hypothetical protein MNB_SV-4-313 [hydrothermal vent metagenome]|uniref:Uncharacterized protein n=1 Tax=hydrothermal vent metagenome TaxID=652676 RepID=A0A1W1EA50_9ZZZZ
MKKKRVKNSTLLNLKGILILLAFGIWVNLIIGVKENLHSVEDALYQLGGNTILIITVTYVVLVIVGIFFEAEQTDRML